MRREQSSVKCEALFVRGGKQPSGNLLNVIEKVER
jgi:hypothetical protein